MAKNIAEAIRLLQKIGFNEITNMKLDNTSTTYHVIKHKFREEVCIPLVAITNNIDFFVSKGEKEVICSDGIKAKVVNYKECHICTLEEDIRRMYNMDIFSFLKKWYNYDKCMDSMTFIKMKLKKYDD